VKHVHRILVVEADHELREAFSALLVDAGYDVRTASNGLGALRAARASPPDVIVLDMMTPVMNAWEFRRVQRSDPRLGRIPVVAVCASVPGGEIDVAVRLVKPYELRSVPSGFRVLENSAVLVPLRGGPE
jgi:CheY-like chemotaxis protein